MLFPSMVGAEGEANAQDQRSDETRGSIVLA
jgi:hypothetical protein